MTKDIGSLLYGGYSSPDCHVFDAPEQCSTKGVDRLPGHDMILPWISNLPLCAAFNLIKEEEIGNERRILAGINP